MKRFLPLLLAACLSAEDMKKQACAIACHVQGWDTGTYENGYCLCIDFMKYSDLVETKLAELPRIPRSRIFHGE